MELLNYFDVLAQANHTAGGGSAAAVNGALASSLIIKAYKMVLKNDEELPIKVGDNYFEDLERTQLFFKEMILADGEAFGSVLAAYRLPKTNDEEKAIRKEAIQDAYKNALESPYMMMIHITKLYDFIFRLKDFSNPMADSELLVANSQIMACYNSAKVNVLINQAYIKDESFLEKKRNNIRKIEQNFVYNMKKFQILFIDNKLN